ncbi:Orn/DAP/Arg decarboxylase 2 [Cucurbitaria berberidis CBS 394.84]|uniref:Arginine decarboxylase n=1 Tax=Cucurbitaria berberidis CBS 394.84 TaxID=1168544 RepID=A0A9P4G6Y2_9PLEO|nr:Orn/DAP/Arg decarboxylase 2 [Cucurbitaria berberidis CBS 394.84]KAF1840165.1 Orn/DAP/Arg decarboxylase 2 [Cucurbitaria berberidis CBS 394.84]
MIRPLCTPSNSEETYHDLIHQTFNFPTPEFHVESNELYFNNVPLMDLVKQYGTPLKITYLPKISEHIQRVTSTFRNAMKRYYYQGNYTYCYCTKSSHFRFVLDEVLKDGNVHLETSSAFDVPIVRELYRTSKIDKRTYIICNGSKRPSYTKQISELIQDGFNVIPVLDSLSELDAYQDSDAETVNLGIRIATDEASDLPFHTSRLGIRYSDVTDLYHSSIDRNPKFKLKLLHFFVNTGIKDTAYYWTELGLFLHKYCELRKVCPDLDSIDIGGGLPIQHALDDSYDYEGMVDQIISVIQKTCTRHSVPVPHLFTEFGSYTVGESGATIYRIIEQKRQNDAESWYMIDGSFITHLPDTWGINQKFITLPLNNWDSSYQKVLLGGLTCDSRDFYAHPKELHLPVFDQEMQGQYIGFFHTGAYQEALGGYGGISHCLIPAPQHVIVDRDEHGRMTSRLFAPEQDSEYMMQFLGYTTSKGPQATGLQVALRHDVSHSEAGRSASVRTQCST